MGGKLEPSDSEYDIHIKNWFKFIPKEQLFIINFSDLVTDISRVLASLYKFLGLKENFVDSTLPDDNTHRINASIDCNTFDRLHEYYVSRGTYENTYQIVDSYGNNSRPYFSRFNTTKNCS